MVCGEGVEERAEAQMEAEEGVAIVSRVKWRVLSVRALILEPHSGSRWGC